jgi:hypothetical protein
MTTDATFPGMVKLGSFSLFREEGTMPLYTLNLGELFCFPGDEQVWVVTKNKPEEVRITAFGVGVMDYSNSRYDEVCRVGMKQENITSGGTN